MTQTERRTRPISNGMRKLVRKHKQKIVIGHGIIVVAFLLSTALIFDPQQTVLFFSSATTTLAPAQESDIDVQINAFVPVNAVSAVITYPRNLIEVLAVDRSVSSFDLWTHEPSADPEKGVIVISGGTFRKEGLVGTSTVVRLSVRAKGPGEAELNFKDVMAISNDGAGTIVRSAGRPLTYSIVEKQPVVAGGGGGGGAADFNGDSRTTITDVSMFLAGLISAYDARYDINTDGMVGLTDLSILLSYF